jgi:SAM-dependent methyltransferase
MSVTRADTELLLRIPDEVLTALRERMASVGFDEDMVGRCEEIVPGQIDVLRLPLVHAVLEARGDATGVVTQLFAYKGTVSRAPLEQALGRDVVAALVGAGWLVAHDGGLRARVRIMPFFGLWIASDECPTHDDPVAGPGASTGLLARSLVFAGMRSFLDIGCGAGSLALLARARGVPEVMGVDLDPRAIAYSELNARLNGLTATWAAGDLAAPAGGRRFDAVVAQPPFVTHPDGVEGTTYLHGGKRGDELTMRLLGELDGVLSDRGRAWVFFESPETPTTLRERVRTALRVDDVHCMLVFGGGHTPDRLSVAYAALTEPTLGERYATLVRRYREHLTALDIDRTRHLLLHVERTRAARPYTVVLEPPTLMGYDGAGVDALRGALEIVASPDDDLLRRTIRPAKGASLVQEQSLCDPEVRRLRVRFDGGRGIEQELSDSAAMLLETFAGAEPDANLASCIAAHAKAIEAPEDRIDATTREVLAFVRRGLVTGMLSCDPE